MDITQDGKKAIILARSRFLFADVVTAAAAAGRQKENGIALCNLSHCNFNGSKGKRDFYFLLLCFTACGRSRSRWRANIMSFKDLCSMLQ